jgi:hypothetical protein
MIKDKGLVIIDKFPRVQKQILHTLRCAGKVGKPAFLP